MLFRLPNIGCPNVVLSGSLPKSTALFFVGAQVLCSRCAEARSLTSGLFPAICRSHSRQSSFQQWPRPPRSRLGSPSSEHVKDRPKQTAHPRILCQRQCDWTAPPLFPAGKLLLGWLSSTRVFATSMITPTLRGMSSDFTRSYSPVQKSPFCQLLLFGRLPRLSRVSIPHFRILPPLEIHIFGQIALERC